MSNINVIGFSRAAFFQCVDEDSRQTKYLFYYIDHLNAKTIILEKRYIDRYYMEEFEHYYSTCFSGIPNICQRLHFFSEKITKKEFDSCLLGNHQQIRKLQDSYLGFIVLRPLATIKIGRTVLETYKDNPKRKYITRNYKIHLSGIELSVDSIAFQQQDIGIGACATTAIWSSLQKVCSSNGYRCPGPFSLSQKASQFRVPFGRAFPQTAGLTSEQMYQAILGNGFTPLRINCSDKSFNQFKAILLSYLRSDIPPIMNLQPIANEDGHAVAITGYSEKDEECNFDRFYLTKDIDKIYIHDDRNGPYTRARLFEREFSRRERKIARDMGFYSKKAVAIKIQDEEWLVSEMIVPLYHKIRADYVEIMKLANPLLRTLRTVLKEKSPYMVDLSILKGGDFLKKIIEDNSLLHDKKINFLSSISLPRYTGVVEVYRKSKRYFSVLYDTTDISRVKIKSMKDYSKDVLGIICYDNDLRNFFSQIWEREGITTSFLL